MDEHVIQQPTREGTVRDTVDEVKLTHCRVDEHRCQYVRLPSGMTADWQERYRRLFDDDRYGW